MSHFSKNLKGFTPTPKNFGVSSQSERGFTLLELLVTITIMTIILTVVLMNQSTYSERSALTNLADEISVTLSQAQAYGVGVREVTPGSNQFNYQYGLSFNIINPPSNKSIYIRFIDRNGDDFYNGDSTCPVGISSECLEKATISRNNYINSLCAVMPLGVEDCSIGRVDVSFQRPKTEAQFTFLNTSGIQVFPLNFLGARINLKSPKGYDKSVVVYKTGQISVQ